jgi:hypothetical protein
VAQDSMSILGHPQRLAARQKGRIWAAAIANAIDFLAAHIGGYTRGLPR